MSDREPLKARGEVSIRINGEPKIIRFSLRAQAKIVQKFGLDSVDKIPELMRKVDGELLAYLVYAALIEEDQMSVDELLDANIPLFPAIKAVLDAINLATRGTTDDVPFDESKSLEAETKTENPGVSQKH